MRSTRGHSSTRRRPVPHCFPCLEYLEERRVLSAVRLLPGTALTPGDDNSSAAIALGFSVNLYGATHGTLFVNNNGNITFQTSSTGYVYGSGLKTSSQPILAPLVGDVDTRPDSGGVVSYGSTSIGGHQAFAASWIGVGFYNRHTFRTNTFQVVLIDRSDTGSGNFDVEFNYDAVGWEASDSTGGTNGLGGVTTVRAGLAAGSSQSGKFQELPGSGQAGALLDTNSSGLIHGSLNSNVAGRYVYFARGGEILLEGEPQVSIAAQQVREGQRLNVTLPARDDLGQPVTYSLLEGPTGSRFDPLTNIFSWTPATGQLPGNYTVRLEAVNAGNSTSKSEVAFEVEVTNVPAVVTLPASTSVGETDLRLAGNIGDVNLAACTLTVNYGDSLVTEPVAIDPDGSFTLDHHYDEVGTHTVTVTVAESGLNTGTFHVTVEQLNRQPRLAPVSAQHIAEGAAFDLTVSAADPDAGQQLSFALVDAPAGAGIDPLTGAIHWTPGVGQWPGSHAFRVRVSDDQSGALSDEISFAVTVDNVGARVELDDPARPFVAAGEELVLTGKIVDPGVGGWGFTVDFGDGATRTATPNLDGTFTLPGDGSITVGSDGTFTLRHSYTEQSRYRIFVTTSDLGLVTPNTDSILVSVLPAGSLGKIKASQEASLAPGETKTLEINDDTGGLEMRLDVGNGGQGQLSAFLALYSDAPVATKRQGLFFDIQLGNGDEEDTLTLTVKSNLLTGKFAFGYFTTTSTWVSLLDNPDLTQVVVDAQTGTMQVTFKDLSIFTGTVFTVSLASSSTSTTASIRAATASADSGNVNTAALTRQVSFTSSTQLSLGLTTSRDTQAAVSGQAQGSQERSLAAPVSGFNQAGAGQPTVGEVALSGFSAEDLFDLWLQGIDPALLELPLPDLEEGSANEGNSAATDALMSADVVVEPQIADETDLPGENATATDPVEEPSLTALAAMLGMMGSSGMMNVSRGQKRRLTSEV